MVVTLFCASHDSFGQPPGSGQGGFGPPGFGPGGFGPPGFGQGGFGPPGFGPGGEERKLVKQFDADENGWLNKAERKKALAFIQKNPTPRRGPGQAGPGGPGGGGPGGSGPGRGGPGVDQTGGPSPGFGPRPDFGPGGFGPPPGFGPPGGGGPPGMAANRPMASRGARISKSSVQPLEAQLYDSSVLRTIFIDFENKDWEQELEDFHGTDVDVAAELTVDNKQYANCGIHFRGMSSYGMVPAGYKRSLNISLDLADPEQRLLGYKTLNLLNGSGDESMMSTVLYAHIAQELNVPAPKANFVRVVINGENWGIYTNVQQFNKDFLQENFGSDEGARWKVSGSPAGGGGLDYRGPDPEKYQYPYERKSGGQEATAKLIELCRVLDQTAASDLPQALEPLVDVDGLLWFLALDNGLINSDGYWIRASDYSIYLDKQDKFHFIPHDMNEAFRGAGGPGGRGPGGRGPGRQGLGGQGPGGQGFGGPGPGGQGFGGQGPGGLAARRNGGFGPDGMPAEDSTNRPRNAARDQQPAMDNHSPLELDPLIGLDDPSKPLRSKILAVPQYRAQYLANLRELADKSLDWNQLGPFVAQQVALIDREIKTETRKLGSYEAFVAATSPEVKDVSQARAADGPRGGHGSMNLREFAEGRRAYLLKTTSPESNP